MATEADMAWTLVGQAAKGLRDHELEDVQDDGVGLEAGSEANGGLRLMRERALLVGAELRFRRSPLGGTEVRPRVPTMDPVSP